MFSTVANVKSEAGMSQNDNITSDMVTGYITQADGEINSALFEQYVLPLSETPDLIEFISRQLAAGLLLTKEFGYEDNLSEAGREKVRNARSQLDRIASRKLILVKSDGTAMPTKESGTVAFNPKSSSTTSRKFSMADEF